MLVQPAAWEGPWGWDIVWGPPNHGGRGEAGVRRTAEPFTDSLGAAVRDASRTQMPETTLVLTVCWGGGGGGGDPAGMDCGHIGSHLKCWKEGRGEGAPVTQKSKTVKFFPSNYLSPG